MTALIYGGCELDAVLPEAQSSEQSLGLEVWRLGVFSLTPQHT